MGLEQFASVYGSGCVVSILFMNPKMLETHRSYCNNVRYDTSENVKRNDLDKK